MERLFKKLLLFTTLSAFLLLQSCGNEDKGKGTTEQKEVPDSTSTKNGGGTEALTAGPFTVLRLSASDLQLLFPASGPGAASRKLLIQFQDLNDPAVPYMTAVAFNARQNNEYLNVMRPLVTAVTNPQTWDTTGVKILGNNELSIGQITHILGGPVQTHAADLYFYPKKDENNQIFFVVSRTFFAIAMDPKDPKIMITYPPDGEDSKPSPPAPPCTTCD